MTMPHLMNCSHSHSGWCLDCVRKMHEEGDTLRTLLLDIAAFESFDGGPGREIEDVSVQLWCDGSGRLLVKTSAKLPFERLDQLRSMLKNRETLKPKHPEV